MAKPYGALPLNNAEAWDLYERFVADGRIKLVDEPSGLEGHWKTLAARKTSSPKVWMAAYLAAFAIAGGYQFVTTDRGFAQYAGLNLLALTM